MAMEWNKWEMCTELAWRRGGVGPMAGQGEYQNDAVRWHWGRDTERRTAAGGTQEMGTKFLPVNGFGLWAFVLLHFPSAKAKRAIPTLVQFCVG